MSVICNTRVGRLRRIDLSTFSRTPAGYGYVLEVEPCGCNEPISEEQFLGAVSIDHSRGCKKGSDFHQQVNLKALVEASGGWRMVT